MPAIIHTGDQPARLPGECDNASAAHARLSSKSNRKTVMPSVASAIAPRAFPSSADTDAHPDAKLIEMGIEFAAISHEYDAVWSRAMDLSMEVLKASPPPAELAPQNCDADIFGFNRVPWRPNCENYTLKELEGLTRHCDSWPAKTYIRYDALRRALRRWQRAMNAYDKKSGCRDMRARSDDLEARVDSLGVKILETSATTIDGLIVKAKVAQWCSGGDFGEPSGKMTDQAAFHSLARNLLALGEASSLATPSLAPA